MHSRTQRLRRKLSVPKDMEVAPNLGPAQPCLPQVRSALLVNPFYPKDRRASFGKHVLTLLHWR